MVVVEEEEEEVVVMKMTKQMVKRFPTEEVEEWIQEEVEPIGKVAVVEQTILGRLYLVFWRGRLVSVEAMRVSMEH